MSASRTIEVLRGDALVVRVVVEGPRVAVTWIGSEHEAQLRSLLRGPFGEPTDTRAWIETLRVRVCASPGWRVVDS